jgi:hypothetical protein
VRVAGRATVSVLAVLLVVVAAALAAVVLRSSPAAAECPPDPVGPDGLCATAEVTITPTPQPTGGPVGDPGEGPPTCQGAPGGECQHGNSWWSSAGKCYANPLDPQPAPGSPVWESIAGDATDGTLMVCSDSGEIFYVPEGAGGGIPDARTIALNAVKQVPFVMPGLQIAPPPTYHSYINYENWLWIPANQWRNVQASVSVGGTTVTVTAEPVRTEWDMGDGKPVKNCYDAGRPWVKGMSEDAVTACGYAYKDTSVDADPGYFTITGQLFYDVRWSCTGACSAPGGPLGVYPGPTSSSCLTVYQRQTVNRNGSGGTSAPNAPSLCP